MTDRQAKQAWIKATEFYIERVGIAWLVVHRSTQMCAPVGGRLRDVIGVIHGLLTGEDKIEDYEWTEREDFK